MTIKYLTTKNEKKKINFLKSHVDPKWECFLDVHYSFLMIATHYHAKKIPLTTLILYLKNISQDSI